MSTRPWRPGHRANRPGAGTFIGLVAAPSTGLCITGDAHAFQCSVDAYRAFVTFGASATGKVDEMKFASTVQRQR